MDTITPELKLNSEQITYALEQAKLFLKLQDLEDPKGLELFTKMAAALGEDRWLDCIILAEERKGQPDLDDPPAKSGQPQKRKGLFRQARRVSRTPETWRVLKNYPLYEISSHGRVRALDRAHPDDWLKPRRKWYRGLCPDSVVLRDHEGKRCERFIGKLLIAAGFMPQPQWMERKF